MVNFEDMIMIFYVVQKTSAVDGDVNEKTNSLLRMPVALIKKMPTNPSSF